MDNPDWVTDSMYFFATALHRLPGLQLFIDVMLKSVVVLIVCLLLDRWFSYRFGFINRSNGKTLASSSRHLLWLNGLLCLAILPWLPALFFLLSLGTGQSGAPNTLFELTVVSGQQQATNPVTLGIVLLIIYLIPVALLLFRLLSALVISQRIYRNARPLAAPKTTHLLFSLKQKLLISRRVNLRLSDAIESPVSFGLFTPAIILPAQARDWNASVMTDVLLHELCHIKRLDWLTTLFAYGLACVYWINPLVWLALKRLHEESEYSCDTAVLNAGRSDTDYAESLLGVASHCIHARRTKRIGHPLMQTMLDQNTLISRISRVLEENKMQASDMKKQIRKTTALLLVFSAAMLGVLGVTQVLSAQEQEQRPSPATRAVNEEMLPLHNEEPVYPKAAADAGIEGWVHVRFTVNAAGSIDESSVSVVDAEPADMFNNSAMNATKKFRFSPRITNGEPVAVPNVQYVFRYKLSQESVD